MLYAVADVVDRSLARKNALELATLLGARSSSQQRNVVGEPTCPYKVRLNTDAFWFGVGVSDASYVVAGNWRGTFGNEGCFGASLKTLRPGMSLRLEGASRELGVPVYVANHAQAPKIAAALCSPTCRPIIQQIQWSALKTMFLSPVQIHAIGDFRTSEQCAIQVTVLRDLLLAFSSSRNA
ncbi:hypothetical protein [uncultured Pseudoxanthomonas sp.]|uniref:hypothetical protein n=1 Tax=uncultured Pseudoxanthomonas sp. TaxID=281701 RepID=UPI00262965B3|nr:hypothetical protein [uncultured Pseudoxanthomonas sp.]